MDTQKISNAIERLEQNLPLRHNQVRLAPALRQLHQSILCFFLEQGRPPLLEDSKFAGDLSSAIKQLADAGVIVLDSAGAITGAYPFVYEDRGFRVLGEFGEVNAMCAFDALAISSMFEIPVRIESSCRLTGRRILIEQYDASLSQIEPVEPVYAAIDWDARDSRQSCSASLCTEMMFISGEANAVDWQEQSSGKRELFSLTEAHSFIAAVFVPLMQPLTART
ncbi:MAG: hypothetical protein GY806_14755 [Gammaproteobacteria bacterium]|nr:hypothetical protein [Gammaproteobacteria bacterium]